MVYYLHLVGVSYMQATQFKQAIPISGHSWFGMLLRFARNSWKIVQET